MVRQKIIVHNSTMPRCQICASKEVQLQHVKERYRYYRCKNCLTLFLYPIASQKTLGMYYQKEFAYTAGISEEKRLHKMATHIMHNMKNLNCAGQDLLDIGSGYGVFLQEAKKCVPNVTGIEPSKSLYNYSKPYIRKHIMNINLQEFLEKNTDKYDFITLIHVIEHLLDPKKILKQIIALLKPNGILYIETPNIDSHLYDAEKDNYTFLTPPDHIWLFSPRSFKEMLKNFSNIQIERLSTYSHPEHFMGIIKNKLKVKSQKSKVTIKNSKLNIDLKLKISNLKLLKYILFDKFFAPIFTPLLNIGNKGSILELYIRKTA